MVKLNSKLTAKHDRRPSTATGNKYESKYNRPESAFKTTL